MKTRRLKRASRSTWAPISFVKSNNSQMYLIVPCIWGVKTLILHMDQFRYMFTQNEYWYTSYMCNNCFKVCNANNIPPNSKSNGYAYLPKPTDLPKLNSLIEHLILCIPYVHIRRKVSYVINRQITRVLVDVNTVVRSLPR